MELDLSDLHDAVLTNDRYEPDGSLVLEFEGPYRMLRRLTFPADCRPKIWHSGEKVTRSVNDVELRSVSQSQEILLDEQPVWRDEFFASVRPSRWVYWFVANAGESFAVVVTKPIAELRPESVPARPGRKF